MAAAGEEEVTPAEAAGILEVGALAAVIQGEASPEVILPAEFREEAGDLQGESLQVEVLCIRAIPVGSIMAPYPVLISRGVQGARLS